MIRSFADATTEDLFGGHNTRAARMIPRELWRAIRRKLTVLDGATSLGDVAQTPGYRLKALRGEEPPRYSIRVNDQYRITFRFEANEAHDVRCEDYH